MLKKAVFLLWLCFAEVELHAQQAPGVVDRIVKRDTNIVIYKTNGANRFIVATGVNKRTRSFYLLDKYGSVYDSLLMRPAELRMVLQGKIDPVTYYTVSRKQIISYHEAIIDQLNYSGKLDPSSPYYNTILWEHPEFKNTDSVSLLKNIVLLHRQNSNDSLYLWVLQAEDMRNANPEDVYLKDDADRPGAQFANGDTLFCVNRDNLSKVHMALLIKKKSRLYFYNRDGACLAWFGINPDKRDSIFKKDVFEQYVQYLEFNRRELHSQIKLLTPVAWRQGRPVMNRQYANYTLAQTHQLLGQVLQQYQSINRRIDYAASPDVKAVNTRLQQIYLHQAYNGAWLTFLNVPFDDAPPNWYIAGTKTYELTNLPRQCDGHY